MPPPTVSDAERRARLVARHGLAGTARDPADAVRSVVAMHSSDPLTPYLGIRARVPGCTIEDVDRALYETRALSRVHAMRRTLWVAPTEDLAMLHGAAGEQVARRERSRLHGWLADELPADRVEAWVEALEGQILDVLEGEDGGLTTRDLTARIPDLTTEITVGSGRWTTRTPVSSRLLFVLAMEGAIVRARPLGSWRSSQYRWATASEWLGRIPDPVDASAARSELARRYLAAFGPATAVDLRWWAGWTATQTTAALESVATATVTLEDGAEGYLLAEDEGPTASTEGSGVAFLPGLDPTPMGWKQRGWYLGDDAHEVYDANGNAGPTVWVDGRIVGGWTQRSDGTVVVALLEEVDAPAAVQNGADELTAWLDGEVVSTRFPSPLERRLSR